MSTCVDVVTPFDFDAPASLPPGARKFTLAPLTQRGASASNSSHVSSFSSSSSWVDRLPQRDALRRPFDDEPRALYAEDAEPAYVQPPPASVVTMTAEYMQSDSKRSVGKPTRIKLIEWRPSTASVSLRSASSASSSASSTTAVCQSDAEYEETFPSIHEALAASGGDDAVEDSAPQARVSAAQKRKHDAKIDDDDGDEEDGTDGARYARNRRLMREPAAARGAHHFYNDDTADPLAGVFDARTEQSEFEADFARIIDQMEDF